MEPEENPSENGGLEGVTHEDILAAVAILREDEIIKTGRESREAIKVLEEKYRQDREEDSKRWERLEASQPKTPENDPEPTPPGVPEPPAPVPPNAPVGDGGTVKEKKRKGLWFREEEETS
jgi:uncharacterized protein YoaH (UPF0181 family)